MFKSIRTALEVLFILFALLVIVTVGVTFWALNAQKQDALVINLAGRQRMLVQQMTRLALEIRSGEEQHIPELESSMAAFSETLAAFLAGGRVPYLPGRSVYVEATRDPLIREQLYRVQGTWAQFRSALLRLKDARPGSAAFDEALGQVRALEPVLVAQSDAAVRLYESASTRKVERLRWIQSIFLAAALLLVGWGVWLVRRVLLAPLSSLRAAAERIGQGDLETPVQTDGPRELHTLAATFEEMRAQLLDSRRTLLQWGQELEARVAHRTQELEALNRVSREISARLEPEHVLRTITDKARELLGGEIAVLCLLKDDGQMLQMESLSGPVEAIRARQTPARETRTRVVLHAETASLCDGEGGTCGPHCRILAPDYRASHLVASLKVRERVIGTLCVGASAERQFGAEDVDLLTRLANSAAIALENARLYRQAERLAALEERQRIAAEMHDGLAQTLSSIGLLSDRITETLAQGRDAEAQQLLQQLRAAVSRSVGEVRQAIASLRRDAPPPRSLQEELQTLVGRYQQETPAEIAFRLRPASPVQLPEDRLQQVQRVAEEALRNAVRHSGARHIAVELAANDHHYRLVIRDDGRGFAPERVPPRHFGLQIMRARAAHLNGRLEIQSSPGRGTEVALIWPGQAPLPVEAT